MRNAGFTLIELVVVITLLGVLAAFAVPRFADLRGSAQAAAIQSLAGGTRAGWTLAHSVSIATGAAINDPVQMEGQAITMINAYPDAQGMIDVAQFELGSQFQMQVFGDSAFAIWATGTPGWTSCGFVYIRSIPPTLPVPSIFGPNTAGCN